MKKIMLIFLILLFIPSIVLSAPALTWDDPNPPEAMVDLYEVMIDGVVVAQIVPNTWVIVNIPDGNHNAQVRAHNAVGWSAWSSALNFDLPYLFNVPDAPTNLRIIDFQVP
jgi:hypothetical protein